MSREQTEELEDLLQVQLLAARTFRDVAGQADLPPMITPELYAAGVARAFAFGQRVAIRRGQDHRTCRVCGCWWFGACEGGCWWVEADLCSACDPDAAGHGAAAPMRAAHPVPSPATPVGQLAGATDEGSAHGR